jgi:hypothetical protein
MVFPVVVWNICGKHEVAKQLARSAKQLMHQIEPSAKESMHRIEPLPNNEHIYILLNAYVLHRKHPCIQNNIKKLYLCSRLSLMVFKTLYVRLQAHIKFCLPVCSLKSSHELFDSTVENLLKSIYWKRWYRDLSD